MNKLFWFVYIIIISTISTLLIRQLTITKNLWILALIVVLSLAYFWGIYRLFSYGEVGVSYALITGSVILLVALGAKYFYKEAWSGWTLLGLALIISGIFVLGLFKPQQKIP